MGVQPNPLQMGTMVEMGILHKNMWSGNPKVDKGDQATSRKWRKEMYGQENQKAELQYKWLPRYVLPYLVSFQWIFSV